MQLLSFESFKSCVVVKPLLQGALCNGDVYLIVCLSVTIPAITKGVSQMFPPRERFSP